MNKVVDRVAFVALLAAANATMVRAQDWPHWRGPAHNGSAPAVAKNLPVRFSPTENVKWAAAMPGPSAATPVVYGDNVYTPCADFDRQALFALCLDRKTGKERWRHAVGSGYKPAGEGEAVRIDDRSNYASPSPVTDGKRVVFFYGNGDLAAFTPSGKKLWQRNLQKEYGDFAFQWTFSSSPTLHAGTLYLQVLQRDRPIGGRGKPNAPSFLLALDPDTGKELWKKERPTAAIMESREAFTTPIPNVRDGKAEILIAGGDFVTAHDPKTGEELWRWGTWNEEHRQGSWRLVPSPVAGEGTVLVCAPKRAPVYAAKPGPSSSPATLAWKSEDRSDVSSDVPTPLFYGGKFFVLSDVRRALSCVEPRTGQVRWTVPIPRRQMCWGSPTGADGKVYAISLNGDVFVFDAADGKLLAENAMGGEGAEIRSSIAVAHGNLFVRTNDKLYCIGR